MGDKQRKCTGCGQKKPIKHFGFKTKGNRKERTKRCDDCKRRDRERWREGKVVKQAGLNPYGTEYIENLIQEVEKRKDEIEKEEDD